MQFPKIFLNRMQTLLGGDYPRFLAHFTAEKTPYRALRINPLKCTPQIKTLLTSRRAPTPFCREAYYLAPEEKLGASPYHHAGAFYLQEPSAGSAAQVLDVKPGETVLDLCAAPGGKATQLAGKLAGKGLLWCNEYVAARTQPLLSNLERLGVANAVVSSLAAEVLAERLPQFFDKILVDAPCSGEGMMRKEPATVTGWSEENIRLCAARQRDILNAAAAMLKPGGRLCYSTCTFAPEENELQIAAFLQEHTDFHLIPIPADFGQNAFAHLAPETQDLELARRIFPFHGGEGHFVALLEKTGCAAPTEPIPAGSCDSPIFEDFYKENFASPLPGNAVTVGERVYITTCFPLPECPVIRNGILAGTLQKGRFVPAHGLFACPACRPKQTMCLTAADPRTAAFLHGEEIACDTSLRGFCGVQIDGMPLGFGKASQGRLKNHYPKGLRTL